RKYADIFELGGIDECYIDASKSAKNFDQAAKIALQIKEEIKQKEKLTCSIGIGPNKLIAKMASDFQKPDGLTVVGPAAVARFLRQLDVRKLRFVGPKTEAALKERGIETISQLRHTPKFALVEWFGKSHGEYLYRASRGMDDEPLIEHWEAKSIGREWTFERDASDEKLIYSTIDNLSQGVYKEFKGSFASFKTITVKIRFQGFETHTSQQTMKAPSSSIQAITETARALLEPFLKTGRKIRLIGVRISHLEKSRQTCQVRTHNTNQ
ncbi:MAG: DNA polymerase IV, partial [Candidatus Micrarchaeota archaeon]